jgi:DNA-binding SARP family transcriptional activator
VRPRLAYVCPEPTGWEAREKSQAGAQISVVAAKLRIPTYESYALVRLDAVMDRLWGGRVALVVAPAGSGKTTLLSRFASLAGVPVAWYRCESWDVSQDHLLRHLEEAFASALGQSRHWPAVEDAVSDLEQWSGARLLLLVDDAHTIAGTQAERALERFIDYAPASLLTVIASRSQPGFNLSRLRVSGALTEISGDDLRFRSWEVENLFRDFYREPLPPIELAELARRTEGWAAGLKLFHLATSGKGLEERRRILRALSGGSRLVREYLARNVLDELRPPLRAFLIDTCVLGRLSGPICDRFLDRTDSESMLHELEQRQIFTTTMERDGDYRYHEILRSHLEHALLSDAGERGLTLRYAAAGKVLEEFGAVPESVHAYCRAEDWTAVGRLLGRNGEQLARRTGVWIDALPPAVLEHDPWLLLASARRHRAEGRWASAIEAYQRAEVGFTGLEGTRICQRERQALAVWLHPVAAPAVDSLGLLRLATIRDPLAIKMQLAGQQSGLDRLVAGLASLLAGEVVEARRLFSLVADVADENDALEIGARLGASLASLMAGAPNAAIDLEQAVEDADARGQGFLARLGRACTALVPGSTGAAEAAAVRSLCDRLGDPWGSGLATLLEALGLILAGKSGPPTDVLIAAADNFHELRAPVLEAWIRSLHALALAREHDPSAQVSALKAESLANSVLAEGPKLFIYRALADASVQPQSQFIELAKAVQARTGLSARFLDLPVQQPAMEVSRPVWIRCFGEFRIAINGHAVVMTNMKPRARALLRRLGADAGSPVHREVLQEALWPSADADAAARNLHVAISSLRQALEPGIARGASSVLVREGEAYRLVLPPGSEVDLRTFDQALETCRRARVAGEIDRALSAFEDAAAIGAMELLPEDGSAEWVVMRRERARAALLDVARPLAEHLVANGEPARAAEVSMSALSFDRYDDRLWRTLIEARRKAGDEAGAIRAQSEYRRMLLELEPRTTGS